MPNICSSNVVDSQCLNMIVNYKSCVFDFSPETFEKVTAALFSSDRMINEENVGLIDIEKNLGICFSPSPSPSRALSIFFLPPVLLPLYFISVALCNNL